MTRSQRKPTATSNFGSGRRESHDATAFYERFTTPEVSDDTTVNAPADRDVIYLNDARDMTKVADNSVALIATSPPYFAGKAYEENLGQDGIPATYFEYLEMLRDVFAECKRVLEPGGRIAVNVANLGRRPYRSLSADVTEILQSLGLLLRGEVVWWKGRAAGGSCAWGTFQQPRNPVLRDVTERIVIAGKGRFDRALTPAQRAKHDLPHVASITRDEFLESTTDLWEIPPESANRVGHPAPFPVALPARLIELYTYRGDLVLDPFMGSGSTAVAAVRAGRHFIGFDTDPDYIAAAEARIGTERDAVDTRAAPTRSPLLQNALDEGRQARDVAVALLGDVGFANVRTEVKVRGAGVTIDVLADDATGTSWAFDVSGSFGTGRNGLIRGDVLHKAIARAAVITASDPDLGVILLSSDLPTTGNQAAMLRSIIGPGRPVYAAASLVDSNDARMLANLAANGSSDR